MELELEKKELLDFTHQSFNEKLFAGTSGNLSVYDRENDVIIITPSSIAYETMELEDIMVIKTDGTIVEGKHKPSSEWRMHAEIYKKLSSVNSIVHTHSPYATSFAVSGESIPVILIEMVPFLGGDVKVAKFALPGTPEVGTEALKVLPNRNACLLANHGVLTIGKNLAQAHIRAIYVEDAAKIYAMAKWNGHVNVMEDKYVDAMLERMKNKGDK